MVVSLSDPVSTDTYFTSDPSNKDMVLLFAQMSSSAYNENGELYFYDLDPISRETELKEIKLRENQMSSSFRFNTWRIISSFGWNSNKLQGHIYTDSQNTSFVLAFKGTSFKFMNMGGPTAENDQIMDNLMFSCCCASKIKKMYPCNERKQDKSFNLTQNKQSDLTEDAYFNTKPCDCHLQENICSYKCLYDNDRNATTLNYYLIASTIYRQLRESHPGAQIFVTGHSLGGAIASLIAYQYDLTAFTYESPPVLFYLLRMQEAGLIKNGLIKKNSLVSVSNKKDFTEAKIYNFGNDGDPIFIGSCGFSCSLTGYVLETKYHFGLTCVYPAWITSINNHRIDRVILKYIIPMDVPVCTNPYPYVIDTGTSNVKLNHLDEELRLNYLREESVELVELNHPVYAIKECEQWIYF
jgi:putative lipase involved disintegration of autophagic bodies